MSQTRWALALGVLVTMLPQSALGIEPPNGSLRTLDRSVPSVLAPPVDGAEPLWVSAELAADAAGEINWPLLGDTAKVMFETVLSRRYRAHSEEGAEKLQTIWDLPRASTSCVNLADFELPMYGPYQSRLSAKRIVDRAAVIFQGRIIGIAHGFYTGQPGSLLKIEVNRLLKENPTLDPYPVSFVFFPNGDFTVGKYHFCNRHSIFSSMPEIGDSVTVMSVVGKLEDSVPIYEADELIFVTQRHGVMLSREMAGEDVLSEADNAYEVEQSIYKLMREQPAEADER